MADRSLIGAAYGESGERVTVHTGGRGQNVMLRVDDAQRRRDRPQSGTEWQAYIRAAPSFAVAQERMEEAVQADVDFADLTAQAELVQAQAVRLAALLLAAVDDDARARRRSS